MGDFAILDSCCHHYYYGLLDNGIRDQFLRSECEENLHRMCLKTFFRVLHFHTLKLKTVLTFSGLGVQNFFFFAFAFKLSLSSSVEMCHLGIHSV